MTIRLPTTAVARTFARPAAIVLAALQCLVFSAALNAMDLGAGRFVSFTRANTLSFRVEHGLGSPDHIEQKRDGTFIFWYRWEAPGNNRHAPQQGLGGFQFGANHRLETFTLLMSDGHGGYVNAASRTPAS